MGKVYACSDLHGMLELYKQIKEFLQPEDKVYMLGDMGDRGTDCWETVKAIMNAPQFEVIKGNHEDMLIKAIKDYLRAFDPDPDLFFYSKSGSLLIHNGGMDTMKGWMAESNKAKWFNDLNKLPTHLEYKNKDGKIIFMSHAGFTPYTEDEFPPDEELIWDRNHYLYTWPHDALENAIVIHGHTPIEYIVDDQHRFSRGSYELPKYPLAYWYANGHKCCIDNGAFFTNCTVLLDLDTFEEHKFYTKDYDPEAIWD